MLGNAINGAYIHDLRAAAASDTLARLRHAWRNKSARSWALGSLIIEHMDGVFLALRNDQLMRVSFANALALDA